MTIGNALNFIERGLKDTAFRDRLNDADTLDARQEALKEEGLPFSDHEFDEAFHHRLTLCQEEEEANQIREFKMWWDLLTQFLNPTGCKDLCSGCGR